MVTRTLVKFLSDLLLLGALLTTVSATNSNVYGWGLPFYSPQIGNNATVPSSGYHLPQVLPFFSELNETVVKIRCIWVDTVYALTDSGRVYIFCGGDAGVLWELMGGTVPSPCVPKLATPLLAWGAVADVQVLTVNSALCLLANGSVVSIYFQDAWRYELMPEFANQHVVQIAAVAGAAFALADDGVLYAWGDDVRGLQGNGPGVNLPVERPTVVDYFAAQNLSIVQLAASNTFEHAEIDANIGVLTSTGKLYAWGLYSGAGSSHPPCMDATSHAPGSVIDAPLLAEMTADRTLDRISNGGAYMQLPWFGTYVRDTNGTWWTCNWGYPSGANGYEGRLTPFNLTGQTPLAPGQSPPVMAQVAIGFESALAIDEAGVLYSWGADTYGDTGNTDQIVNEIFPRPNPYFADLGATVVSADTSLYGAWAVTAAPCLPGAPPTTTGCYRCPAGTFADNSSASAGVPSKCTPCSAGSYTDQAGQDFCTACPPGTYNLVRGGTRCLDCGPGTQSASMNEMIGGGNVGGSTSCMACLPGTATTGGRNAPYCLPCQGGTFAGESASLCSPCEGGHWSAPAASTCEACPAGTYGSSQGVETCSVCGYGAYSNATGAVSEVFCVKCPALSTTTSNTSHVLDDCTCVENAVGGAATAGTTDLCACMPGFGYTPTTGCTPCAGNTVKPGVGNTPCVACQDFALPAPSLTACRCQTGYYPSLTQGGICRPCVTGGDCSTGDLLPQAGYWRASPDAEELYACVPASACNATGCTVGRVQGSLLCAVCEAEYIKVPSGDCVYCPSANIYIVIFLIVPLCLLLLGFVYWLSLSPANPAITSLTNFLQLVNETALVPRPASGFVGVFSFDLARVMPTLCAAPLSFGTTWLLQIFVPIFLLIPLTAALFIRRRVKRVKIMDFNRELAACRLSVILFSYVLVTKAALGIFSCSSPVDGRQLLLADRSIVCWSAEHVPFVVGASFVLLIFCLGAPLTLSLLILTPRWLPQRLRMNVSFIVEGYIPAASLWEVVMLTRRFAFVLVAQVAAVYYFWAALALTTVAFVAFMLQHQFRPFTTEQANRLEFNSLVALAACCVLRLAQAAALGTSTVAATAIDTLAAAAQARVISVACDALVTIIVICFFLHVLFVMRRELRQQLKAAYDKADKLAKRASWSGAGSAPGVAERANNRNSWGGALTFTADAASGGGGGGGESARSAPAVEMANVAYTGNNDVPTQA